MTGFIINPYRFASGSSVPSSLAAWAVQTDFTTSGGRLTGITPSLGTIDTTINGSGPTCDSTDGIDTSSITISNYWRIDGDTENWFSGATYSMLMVYEIKVAETGCLLDLNGSNYLGVFQSGSGSSPNQGGSVSMGDRWRANNTDVLKSGGTRGSLYTAMEAGTVDGNNKWVATRDPTSSSDQFRPMQYPLDLNFSPNLYLKGIAFYSNWAETDDVATFMLGEV